MMGAVIYSKSWVNIYQTASCAYRNVAIFILVALRTSNNEDAVNLGVKDVPSWVTSLVMLCNSVLLAV
jgi:hypothetical protein